MRKAAFLWTVSILLCCPNELWAKWWIFGKRGDKPEITDVYVDQISVMDADDGIVTVYNENVRNGTVSIKGYARPGKGKLALAKLSLDDGETWQSAKIERRGAFSFNLTVREEDEQTIHIRVYDSTGTSNDTELFPPFMLRYDPRSVDDLARETLQAMVTAYEREDAHDFMTHVADDFHGDSAGLQEALENDFQQFDNIRLETNIDRALLRRRDIRVSFRWDWRALQRDGSQLEPRQGRAEYLFKLTGRTVKLLAMSQPVIFGVTRADEILTQSNNSDTAFTDEIGGETVDAEEVLLNDGEVFDFSSGIVGANGDLRYFGGALQLFHPSGQDVIQALGPGRLSDYDQAPTAGYTNFIINVTANTVYAIIDDAGNYGLIEVIRIDGNEIEFRYLYNSNGSREF